MFSRRQKERWKAGCVAMKVVSPTDLPTLASEAMGRKCWGARGVRYSRLRGRRRRGVGWWGWWGGGGELGRHKPLLARSLRRQGQAAQGQGRPSSVGGCRVMPLLPALLRVLLGHSIAWTLPTPIT